MGARFRLPSSLVSTSLGYCFRVIVPHDLLPIVSQREIRYSLRTGHLHTAKRRALESGGFVQWLFENPKEANLPDYLWIISVFEILDSTENFPQTLLARQDLEQGIERGLPIGIEDSLMVLRPMGSTAILDDHGTEIVAHCI
jgi:hypothetical protein